MNTKSYFLYLSTSIIALNIIVGLGAIFLVERMIPAIDAILQENAYSVSAAVEMLEVIATADPQDPEFQRRETEFWKNFDKAKKNITLEKEKPVIESIEQTAKNFWRGDLQARGTLTMQLGDLSEINLEAMKKKDKEAQVLSVTGAWGLGLLLLVSIGIQLLFRAKILTSLIEPLNQVLAVLKDFNSGNTMRRFIDRKEALGDIRNTGVLINSVLDRIPPGPPPIPR